MWTLLLAAPAFAEDEAPAEPSEEGCTDDCGHREKKPLRHDLTGEVYVQGLQQGGTALGGGANLVQGWGFLKAEARGESYQHWIGRATIGVDLFPRSRFDLTLGVFAGTVGHGAGNETTAAPSEDTVDVALEDEGRWHFSPTVGTEFGIGTGLGPLSFRWQHANGGGDERFSEDTLRVGFDIIRRRLTTFGQVVYFDPESDPGAGGFGVGAALRI